MSLKLNTIYHGDCLELMKDIPEKSIDMILCDFPYGTTACKWDNIIPFEPLWTQYKRIIKDNGAIVLTASQPFTSALVMSNIKMFKYCAVWNKKQSGNPLLSKKQLMKSHEDIVIFYKNQCTYNPIMEKRGIERHKGTKQNLNENSFLGKGEIDTRSFNNLYYPKSIIEISNANKKGKTHPTQKPVALFEYLIKTYTVEGEIVLDNCAGSGTTGIACQNLNRNYILMEKDDKYFEIAKQRLNNNMPLFKVAI